MFEVIASVFIPTLTNMFMEFAWAACAAMLAYAMNKDELEAVYTAAKQLLTQHNNDNSTTD